MQDETNERQSQATPGAQAPAAAESGEINQQAVASQSPASQVASFTEEEEKAIAYVMAHNYSREAAEEIVKREGAAFILESSKSDAAEKEQTVEGTQEQPKIIKCKSCNTQFPDRNAGLCPSCGAQTSTQE